MSKKSFKKKKKFQQLCHTRVVKEGLVNDANGNWVRADGRNPANSMLAGYKVR